MIGFQVDCFARTLWRGQGLAMTSIILVSDNLRVSLWDQFRRFNRTGILIKKQGGNRLPVFLILYYGWWVAATVEIQVKTR